MTAWRIPGETASPPSSNPVYTEVKESQVNGNVLVDGKELNVYDDTEIKENSLYLSQRANTLDQNIKSVDGKLFLRAEELTESLNVGLEGINKQLVRNFENYLDHQKIIFSIDNLIEGFSDFPQGFAVNQEADELYIARQLNGGTEVKISRYSLSDSILIDTKSFAKSTGAYQEGLPYFYDSDNKLCFLVRTTYSDNIAIFNYTDGILGSNVSVLGTSKVSCDKDRKYFITTFGSADRTEGVYIYDFSSVVDGNPILIKTVFFSNSIADGEKTQGITIVDDKIVLGQGKTYPVLTVLDFGGTILNTIELNKSELGSLAKVFDNQLIDVNSFNYENEGVTFYTYKDTVIPIICHIINNKCYFTLCGLAEFTKINTALNKSKVVSNAINWIRPAYLNDVTDYDSNIKVRYGKNKDGQVFLEGTCTHVYTSQTPNLVLFNLPYPYRPRQTVFCITQASGGADKLNRIEIKSNGDVVLVATTSTSPTPLTSLDGIVFSAA